MNKKNEKKIQFQKEPENEKKNFLKTKSGNATHTATPNFFRLHEF
jgi:hypothetical protein